MGISSGSCKKYDGSIRVCGDKAVDNAIEDDGYKLQDLFATQWYKVSFLSQKLLPLQSKI